MAIQNRRGSYTDFDPTKIVPGEFAVMLQNDPDSIDGKSVYIGFGSGACKRLATYEEIEDLADSASASAISADASADASALSASNALISEQNAELSESACLNYKNIMDDAIETNIPTFSYNPTTGYLSYTGGTILFTMDTEKHLFWEVQL